MLELLKTNTGEIKAVCEWYLVDSLGHFDTQGKYVWIEQLEFSSSINGDGIGLIKEFIKRICALVPQAQFGYFRREKYKGRVKLYTRHKWLKFANE